MTDVNTLRPNELIIGDDNWQEHVDVVVAGERKGRGLIPRNYQTHPQGFYKSATAFDMPLIPRDEWVERATEMAANKTRLSDIRRVSGPNGQHIPSLDQNGVGYCWNHSATMAVILLRAVMNQPYVRLSAFFIGCLIKNYRDEGGWGAAALDFITEHGIPSVQLWPEKSMSRSNDNPVTRANASLHRTTEAWADMSDPDYDRNLTEDQAMTSLFCRIPCIGDFNWWGHSVVVVDPVLISSKPKKLVKDLSSLDFNKKKDLSIFLATFGKRIINSWTDSYGDLGEAVLSGTRCILNGGSAPRVTNASAA